MKVGVIVVALSVGVAGTLGASRLASAARQPEKKDKAPAAQPPKDAPAMPDFEKAMAEMMKYAAPSDEHAVLAEMVGTWDCDAKFWMPGPDGKMVETPSKGQCTFTSELGGRWIRQNFSTDFMGEKFEGIGFTGYDLYKKEYVGTWVDTMMTGMISMKGTYDKASKTLTFTSSYEAPVMGQVKARHVGVQKDADTYIYTMYTSMAGQPETKDGEITYRRRK